MVYRKWCFAEDFDGQNINYLEKEDLINTYNINNVLKRTRGDMQTDMMKKLKINNL